jgi:hypothetical protein
MGHHSVVLADGRVVLIGGHGTGFTSLATADIWNPASVNMSTSSMNYTHDMPALARLADGRYLIAGGSSDLGVPAYATAEIFNPADLSFSPTTSVMNRFRAGAGAATLTGGKVLIAGAWYNHNDANTYGELFDPSSGTFGATGALNYPRSYPFVVATADGKAVVFGGSHITGGSPTPTAVELYDPQANTFSVLANHPLGADSNWYIGAINSYMRPIDDQRLKNGKYLFLTSSTDVVSGAYLFGLMTFDPSDKSFARIALAPALPDSIWLWPPLVDTAAGAAYLLAQKANSDPIKLRLYAVNLASWELTTPQGWYTLPASYYVSGMGLAVLKNGKILLSGGHSQTGYNTNFSPIAGTYLIDPAVATGLRPDGAGTRGFSSGARMRLNGRMLTFATETVGPVTVRLYDCSGRMVAQVFSGNAAAHQPYSIALGAQIAHGAHIATLHAGGGAACTLLLGL